MFGGYDAYDCETTKSIYLIQIRKLIKNLKPQKKVFVPVEEKIEEDDEPGKLNIYLNILQILTLLA